MKIYVEAFLRFFKRVKLRSIRSKSTDESLRKNPLNGLAKVFRKFGLWTSLHGVKNIVDDFDYLNKESTRSKISERYLIA